MHWNVAPDALPVSATFVRVLDRWRKDCFDHSPFKPPTPQAYTAKRKHR